MDNKDIEGGEVMAASKRKSSCMQHSTCAILFLLALTLSISLLALCLSLLSYWHVNCGGKQKQLLLPTAASGQLEASMIKEDEGMYFDDRLKNPAVSPFRLERSSNDDDALLDALCNSTASDENDVPMAHIVPQSSRKTPIPYVGEAHSIITLGWICSVTDEDSTYEGRVHGGMVFNRTSGFLLLPKDGFYYIYSQVVFVASRRLEGEMEINSKMVVCNPGDKCDFPNSQSKTHLQSVDRIIANQYQTLFLGGLFHFPAGTQIAVIASNLLHSGTSSYSSSRPPLSYNGPWTQTYMGAFLVDTAPFEHD